MATRQIGNYRIVEYVGSGGFGSVFKAEDVTSPGRFVAIKELHRKHTRSAVIKQRFFQEALAMARLDHPNIPRLYTFGEDNGSYYLVMEFVSGSPLSDEIHERGPIASDRAVPIISQVLEAVSYAHKNGVIHRDLKPDNIILVDSGPVIVKVLDFGIAKMVGGENLTLTGEGFGTPSYMSPERIVGKSELDARTDVYSLGIILFEMVAGHVPFQSKSTDPALYWVEMRRKHESEPIPNLDAFGVPARIEAIIRRATAKRLEERYRTAEEMLADLRGKQASAGLMITSSPANAEVFVDNIPRGTTGIEKGRLLIEGLTPGLHSVRLAKQGYTEYKIDVSLAAGSPTELQVQLQARSTTAIPRLDITEPVDPNTEKISSGDDAKTAMLMIESLSPGSTVAVDGGHQAVAGVDGRAIVPIGAGAHEIQVADPSGLNRKQTVVVGEQELGSVKTIAMLPAASTDPGPPVPRTVVAPAQIDGRTAGGAQVIEQYQTPQYQSGRPARSGSSIGKQAFGAAAIVILVGLTGLAYYVLRGPGRAPATAQSSTTQQQIASDNQLPIPPTPSQQPTVAPTPVSSPDDADRAQENKNSAKKDKPDIQKLQDIPLAAETPRPEHLRPEVTPAPTPLPVQVPTPRATPYIAPRRDDQFSDYDGDTCIMVSVTGPSGNAIPGLRIVCVDEQAGLSGVRRGLTNEMGRWRNCSVIAGHRVLIRVMSPSDRIMAARQVQLSRGRNVVSIEVASEPTGTQSYPGRKPRFWQRP